MKYVVIDDYKKDKKKAELKHGVGKDKHVYLAVQKISKTDLEGQTDGYL